MHHYANFMLDAPSNLVFFYSSGVVFFVDYSISILEIYRDANLIRTIPFPLKDLIKLRTIMCLMLYHKSFPRVTTTKTSEKRGSFICVVVVVFLNFHFKAVFLILLLNIH